MKPESTYDRLLRLLDAAKGKHATMARETGVSQACVSRTYRRESVPSVTDADLMIAWLEKPDGKPSRRKRRQSAVLLAGHAVGINALGSGAPASTALAD